jgi:putative oxidoreductase
MQAGALTFLGRLLMCVLFVISGWGKLVGARATQASFAKHGLPLVEEAWLLAVIVELGGGLAILVGLSTRVVAVVCAVWCVATALIAHTNFADGMQEVQFLKNMGLAGGFLYIATFGGGAWSLDTLLGRYRTVAAKQRA